MFSPIVITASEALSFLARGVRPGRERLSRWQWVDLFGPEEYVRLGKAIMDHARSQVQSL